MKVTRLQEKDNAGRDRAKSEGGMGSGEQEARSGKGEGMVSRGDVETQGQAESPNRLISKSLNQQHWGLRPHVAGRGVLIRSFRFGKEAFFVLARKSRGCAEAYSQYVAQGTPKVDTARAEKDPFRMETD